MNWKKFGIGRGRGVLGTKTADDQLGSTRLFFVVAFGITWAIWFSVIAGRHGLLPIKVPIVFMLLGVLGPITAAFSCSWLDNRAAGVRELLKSGLRWRGSLAGYAVALCLPAGAILASARMLFWTSADAARLEFNSPLTTIGMFAWVIPIAFAEEIGWRGYALPRLQMRYSSLTASVIVGICWAIWHVPAFFLVDIFDSGRLVVAAIAVYVPLMIAASITHTFVFNAAGGSAFLATVHHAAVGGCSGLTNGGEVGGAQFFAWLAVFWSMAAVVIVVIWGKGLAAQTEAGNPASVSKP